MVHVAVEAADLLESRGVSTEVIDLRTLRPFDATTVVKSVEKTNRVIVIEECWKTGGFGAEIASVVQERAFDSLDGPVGRVGGIEVPAPYNRSLEAACLPDAERVAKAVADIYGI